MDPCGRDNEFVRGIAIRKIQHPHGVGDDFGSERKNFNVCRYGISKPWKQLNREMQLSDLVLFSNLPEAHCRQPKSFIVWAKKLTDSGRNGFRLHHRPQPHTRIKQVNHRAASHSTGTGSSMSSGIRPVPFMHPRSPGWRESGTTRANGLPRFRMRTVSPASSHFDISPNRFRRSRTVVVFM